MMIEMSCKKIVKNIKLTEDDKAIYVCILYILSVLSMCLLSNCVLLAKYAPSISAAFTMKALSITPNRFTEFEQILYSFACLIFGAIIGAIVYVLVGQFDFESGESDYYSSLGIGWSVWFISFIVKKIVDKLSLFH